MSQGKSDLVKIHHALADAQDDGGLFTFLQAEVDILSQYAAARLNKMIRAKWPAEAPSGNLALDKNARWLLGLLAEHLWKTKIEPEELLASFQEGTGRIGHLPDGVLRTLHGILDSSMSGWEQKEFRDLVADTRINYYHFPPLEEAREIFAAKHGDVGWPETDEVALAEVHRVEAEYAAALAKYLRDRATVSAILNDYRDATKDARLRISRAERKYRTTWAKATKAGSPEAEEFMRETADDQALLLHLGARVSEQGRRCDARQELLRDDEVWPPVQDA